MKSLFRKFFSLFDKKDIRIASLLLMIMLVGAILEVVAIAAVPLYIELIAYDDKSKFDLLIRTLDLSTPGDFLFAGAVILFLIYIIKNGFLVFNIVVRTWFVKTRTVKIARRLFTRYMRAPYQFHLLRNTAELQRNVNEEINKIVQLVLAPLLEICLNGIISLCIVIYLLISNPIVTVVVLGMYTLISILFYRSVSNKIKKYGQVELEHRKISVQSIQQGLGSLKEARILNREQYFIDKFLDSIKKRTDAMRYKQIIIKLPRYFIETLSIVGLLVVTNYLVYESKNNVSSVVPILALFTVAMARLRGSISGTVSGVSALRYNMVSIEPVYDDLLLLDESKRRFATPSSSKQGLPKIQGDIRIKNLFFRYPRNKNYILNDINLVIPQGKSVGFVGSTGSGKTTLIDIILGLLEPEEGSVLLNNQGIFKNLPAWQKNIGYVPQSIYLTDDTIRCNIALGVDDEEINEDNILRAVRLSQLQNFVNDLPERLDTFTGERQRIGIARALYHNPKVLIMDEATSALDNATESSIIEAQESLKGERTVIIIAHRLTTVKKCDMLYFVKNGTIKASGNYEQLLSQSAEFRTMAQAD